MSNLRQISEGDRIDKVPGDSLINSKNEWNYFRVPRAIRSDSPTRPRKISYPMLAYMTLENTQTVLMHLT